MTLPTPVYPPLTPRQCAVAELVARGYSTPQIARSLFIAEQTAKNHISDAYVALGWTHDAGNQRVLLALWWLERSKRKERVSND